MAVRQKSKCDGQIVNVSEPDTDRHAMSIFQGSESFEDILTRSSYSH